MSVYQTSQVDLLDLFNAKVGLNFAASALIFSTPKVNDDPSNPANTQIRVSVSPSNASYAGSEVFFYNRLDLARLANYPAPSYPPKGALGVSVYTMLADIKTSMGLDFTTDDLEETVTTGTVNDTVILLKAKPTSLGWIGQFSLPLGKKPLLSSTFTKDFIDWT